MSFKDWDPFKTIEDKFDQTFRNGLRVKRKTSDVVEDILNDKDLNMFFGRISENPKIKQLFFLHRADLFESDSDLITPYLLFCNLSDKQPNKEDEDESKALQHFVKEELGFINRPLQMKFLRDTFGINETNWKDLAGDFIDIMLYFIIQFIRSKSDLKMLINSENFNYEKMREVLGHPMEYFNLENPQDILNSIPLEPAIKGKIEHISTQFFQGIMKSFETGTGPIINPDYKLLFQLPSKIRVRNLLNRSKLSFEEYKNILDELHRHHLLGNVQTITWCENCSLEGLSFSQHKGSFAPSKITRDNCINCEKPKAYSAMFSLHPLLRDAIFSQDGFLAVYFGWQLKTNLIEFKADEYSKNYESDFLIRKTCLVECKMFKTGGDKVTIQSRLDSSFAQIKKHIIDLESDGLHINQAILLWNEWEDTEAVLKKYFFKDKDLFEKYKLKVVPPNQLEKIVSAL